MRYGFVIDQRKCIGCHACTVACKEENQVPLGAFRTWVKYIEKGAFPHTRRFFSVLRCNHCDAAPCVAICPTVALYRRPDGIVDFDGERCIGCKSCMQACPYDALYIDPNTQTAAKCNYCAHRIEVGLEPACVIVCPEQAIVAGDLDDPSTRIARLVATEQVQVRKAEQGTRPKVYYLGAETAGLTPQLQRPTETYLWAQRPAAEVDLVKMVASVQPAAPFGDGGLGRPVYDVPHLTQPWGGKVAAYLWTKAIASGVLMLAAISAVSGRGASFFTGILCPSVALVFLALTTALLILDLKRPDRFHYILIKANTDSWLVRGAWILMAYGVVAATWLVAGVAGNNAVIYALAIPALVLGAATAGYSAFLFGQAEGRDFWQSPLLLPHLVLSAVVAGAAALLLLSGAHALSVGAFITVQPTLNAILVMSLVARAVVLTGELAGSHPNADAAQAARLITRGPWRDRFWAVVVVGGIVLPIALVFVGPGSSLAAAVLALAGLWIYDHHWVKAGQSLPLS